MLDVYSVLQSGITIHNNTVTVNHQCSEDVWGSVKRCFQAYRGEWNGGNNQHFSFPVDPTSFIEHVIKTENIPALNPHSYFPTDDQVAKDTIFDHTIANPYNWKHLERKIRILEPSAGEGALALEILERFKRAGVEVELILCEIDPLNVLALEAKGLSVHQGSFFDMAFDNIDLVIMNPPFKSLEWLKHIRHAQAMLNDKGALVGIVPTHSLYNRSQQSVIDFRNEVALYNCDPLTLDEGTFASAPKTQTRIIETRHSKVVNKDLASELTLIYHANNLKLTLENDGDFIRKSSLYSSPKAIEIAVKSFTKNEEFLNFNMVLTNKVISLVSFALAKSGTILEAYETLHRAEVIKDIPTPPRRSFHQLLFAA